MSAKFPLPARPSFAAPIPPDASSSSPVNAEAGPSNQSLTRSTATDPTQPIPATQPEPTVPSSPPQRPPIDPTKCALCPSAPKYTCPRCALPTCSLPCSSSHKTLFSCSGQRDTSAFVPLSKYTQGEWGGDYAFLEATRRQISVWGKDVSMREVERQEEVRKVREREERRRYREERWKEGQREREEEEKRREKEERVREAKERGEVGWGREFVPGLPGMPGQVQSQVKGGAAAGPLATGNASTPTGSTLAQTATATATTQVTPHYASLLDPATAVALNRANLGPDDSSQRGGRGPHNNHNANKKRPNRGGKLEAFIWEMRKRGVWVEFMPEGMERRRVNQSRWNAGSQELFITLQMIIPLALLPASVALTKATATSPTTPLSQEESAEAESRAGAAAASADAASESASAPASAPIPTPATASASSSPRLATPPGVKVKYTDTHTTVTFTQVLLYKGTNPPGQGGGGLSGTGGGAARGRGRNRGKGQNKDAEGTTVQTGDEGGSQIAEEAQAKDAGGADLDADDQEAGKGREENHEAKEREAVTSTSKHVLPTLSDLVSSLSIPLSLQSLVFALPFHPSPARPAPVSETATGTLTSNSNNNKGKPQFPPLSTSAPLATALRGTAYVEFPILTVYARDQWEGMKREGKVREVGLAEPRNKRDAEGRAGGVGAGATQRHGRQVGAGQESQGQGQVQGQGRGANEVPLSNKRTIGSVQAQTSGAGADLEKREREAKRSKVEYVQTGTAGTASTITTPGGSTIPGLPAKPATPAVSALTAVPSTSIAQARTAFAGIPLPLRPTAVRAATSGLSALGGYGSDSDSDSDSDPDVGLEAEAEAEAGYENGDGNNEDDNDLGYYDKPSADETALPGTAAAGPSSTSSIDSMGVATQPQQQQQAQAQSLQNGSTLSASSLADEFGLSGDMLQAVGKALAADLA